MGYWTDNDNGRLLNDGRTWGDGPADIMDNAIGQIVKTFNDDLGRHPTREELEYGLSFSLSNYNQR